MELKVIFGIRAFPSDRGHQVFDIAAIAVDASGQDACVFESLVRPDCAAPMDILEASGLRGRELELAPPPKAVGERLAQFLIAVQPASYWAFNVDRATRLIGKEPWDIKFNKESCLRTKVLRNFGEEDSPEFKLYDAARLLKTLVPLKRRALSDARVSIEILCKLQRMTHNISTNADFLREAEFILEEGL